MRLGYVIIYVPDVAATLEFYQHAFGLRTRFLHDSKMYGEMETGATALAFASESLIESNDIVARPNRRDAAPAGAEIGLVADDVDSAYRKAVAAGALSTLEPMNKPWGQRVGYVRDNNGFLVEICSLMVA